MTGIDGSYYSVSPPNNPPGPATGSYRVLRGGGWCGNAATASGRRTAVRQHPTIVGDSIGFRCAAAPGM